MIKLWWIALLIKCVLVSFIPLTADENYYWVWSQNLSLSYFDHPPFVAWLFKLGHFFPEIMLKWPAVLFGHISFIFWYYFLKNIGFDEQQCKKWFVLSLFAPLVGMASLILTPDLPVLFFYTLALFAFERALTTQKLSYYVLFGLSVGVGFTAKYHIILILPCLLAYLFMQKLFNKIRWTWVGVSLVFMIIGALPVLYWNFEHDWISFRFQMDHGFGKKDWKLHWPIDYLLTVLIFIFPAYWVLFFKALRENKQKLLIYLSVPIFAFFLYSSFSAKVEGNWSQLAFLPTMSLLAFYDDKSWRIKSFTLFWGVSLIILLFFWRQPRFENCPEKLCEPKRYERVLEIEQNYRPFFASSYQMASYLWFNTKRPIYKLYDMSRTDFYDTLPESKPPPEAHEFYLVKHSQTDVPLWVKDQGYQAELIKNIDEDLVLLRFYR